MLVQAYQLVLKTNTTFITELNELFSKTALEVCEGQQLDMDFEERTNVSITEYLEMIRLKTSVLIGCALKMGAISAGADSSQADLIYDFGEKMGIAFQLRDDYLDAFGESHKVGKQKGGDILSNKKTYLAIKALSNANTEQRKTLQALQSETDSEKKVSQTLQLFTALKVDTEITDLAQSYFEEAKISLNKIEGNDDIKQELLVLSEGLIQREY
jgi:geranylgeranyl diphosphate synthase type II